MEGQWGACHRERGEFPRKERVGGRWQQADARAPLPRAGVTWVLDSKGAGEPLTPFAAEQSRGWSQVTVSSGTDSSRFSWQSPWRARRSSPHLQGRGRRPREAGRPSCEPGGAGLTVQFVHP